LENNSADFKIIEQLLIKYSASDTGEKKQYKWTVYQLFKDSEKAYYLVRTEVLYNIPSEFGICV